MNAWRRIVSLLCYLPAVINTLIILWIFVWPWLDQPGNIHIPWQLLLVLGIFWASGCLLSRRKWYGGIPGAIIPTAVWLWNQSGYSGMSHIDWLPIAAVTILWYAMCGILVYRTCRK